MSSPPVAAGRDVRGLAQHQRKGARPEPFGEPARLVRDVARPYVQVGGVGDEQWQGHALRPALEAEHARDGALVNSVCRQSVDGIGGYRGYTAPPKVLGGRLYVRAERLCGGVGAGG